MSRSIDRCDGGFLWRQRRSSARERERVGRSFYRGLLFAVVIEAGVGAFVWLAICIT